MILREVRGGWGLRFGLRCGLWGWSEGLCKIVRGGRECVPVWDMLRDNDLEVFDVQIL
jgi:hypothetical protein